MFVKRSVLSLLETRLDDRKALLILGPRQTGKSTILKEIAQRANKKILFLNCDEARSRESLESIKSLSQLGNLIGQAEMVMVDEAQRVRDIGIILKLITDNFPTVKLVVSGSSAFELSNVINEPLTGRKWEFLLLPFSSEEMVHQTSYFEESGHLHRRMIYGMYPDVVNNPGSEQAILNELSTSYLYKDIFTFQDVRKPEVLPKLLKALAVQIGSEVTFNNLAQVLETDTATVQRYVDLLEKTFIVFRLTSFSRNVRNELRRSRKIFFYDNGIRNALLSAFQPLSARTDVGPLWENFMVSERIKRNRHHKLFRNEYFWRTTQQQEIDYLEEYDGGLFAYEFKWSTTKPARASKTFLNAYPEATFQTIHPNNYLDEFLNTPNL